jgi:hypothetical protein
MLTLLQFNLPVLAAALAIGILTGRWIFRRAPAPTETQDNELP